MKPDTPIFQSVQYSMFPLKHKSVFLILCKKNTRISMFKYFTSSHVNERLARNIQNLVMLVPKALFILLLFTPPIFKINDLAVTRTLQQSLNIFHLNDAFA